MVAIQFKCTYNRYRKLTVWHSPDELASPLVFAERYHVSQGFHHVGHVRNMISEIIREADELEHLLLSRGLRKVKDLQSLLWGERDACRGDEVTDVFDLWETKLCFLGVDSDILSAKALEYSSDITEELRIGFAVYEYIVDVYLADFISKSIEGLVLHPFSPIATHH